MLTNMIHSDLFEKFHNLPYSFITFEVDLTKVYRVLFRALCNQTFSKSKHESKLDVFTAKTRNVFINGHDLFPLNKSLSYIHRYDGRIVESLTNSFESNFNTEMRIWYS